MKMTTRERVSRAIAHREADRVPVIDDPWQGTLARWREEGMPEGADYKEFFGLDDILLISADNSPRYEERVVEETDRFVIYTTKWGVTQKSFKKLDSTPQFIEHTITSPDIWRNAKERIAPTDDRIPWQWLSTNYKNARERGAFIMCDLFFGFDWLHSWVCGTECILTALIEEPDWCVEMFHHFLDTQLKLYDRMWAAGYDFDALRWPDDLGYKGTLFFSPDMYRRLLKPAHKKAIDWAHAHGIPALMHSCGKVDSLIPDFIDIGLDCLNPLEVKAGMNPTALKRLYGSELAFYGGINAVNWSNTAAMEAEVRRVVPEMKRGGGYIFASDHSVPPDVSLKDFRHIIEVAKEVGSFE